MMYKLMTSIMAMLCLTTSIYAADPMLEDTTKYAKDIKNIRWDIASENSENILLISANRTTYDKSKNILTFWGKILDKSPDDKYKPNTCYAVSLSIVDLNQMKYGVLYAETWVKDRGKKIFPTNEIQYQPIVPMSAMDKATRMALDQIGMNSLLPKTYTWKYVITSRVEIKPQYKDKYVKAQKRYYICENCYVKDYLPDTWLFYIRYTSNVWNVDGNILQGKTKIIPAYYNVKNKTLSLEVPDKPRNAPKYVVITELIKAAESMTRSNMDKNTYNSPNR